jgi:hypothetical protein
MTEATTQTGRSARALKKSRQRENRKAAKSATLLKKNDCHNYGESARGFVFLGSVLNCECHRRRVCTFLRPPRTPVEYSVRRSGSSSFDNVPDLSESGESDRDIHSFKGMKAETPELARRFNGRITELYFERQMAKAVGEFEERGCPEPDASGVAAYMAVTAPEDLARLRLVYRRMKDAEMDAKYD